jgi:hypothetical protein
MIRSGRIVSIVHIVLLAAGLAVLACSPEAEAPTPASEPAPGASRALPGVAEGGSSVVYENGRVTLASRGALLAAVLEKLGRQADFTLLGVLPGRTVEVRLEDVSLVDALSALLVEELWSLEYAPQPGGSHRLVRLHVGGGAPKPLVRLRERQLTRSQAGPRRSTGSREEPAPMQEPRPAWDPEAYEEDLVRRLESRDVEERAEAVSELDTDGEQLRRLIVFAHEDPAVAVRLAALEELEGEQSWAALNAIVVALDDPDPQVVLRTIEVISYLDDESLVPRLKPLLEHRDPDVREATVETIADELTE